MAEPARKFQMIDDSVPAAATPPVARDDAAARQLLFVALRSLSQRTLTAVTNLFSLILVGLVAMLLAKVLDSPTTEKLAGVGGFAVFCLMIDVVRRRK
jgi:hypothetical protein